jgi:putative transposase
LAGNIAPERSKQMNNQTWAMDFVHDQLAMSKKLRVVPVNDPKFSYRAEDVARTLEKICGEVG